MNQNRTPSVSRFHIARTSGEFILIVVGVLAALAVDTWVDQVQSGRDAEQYRARLVSDLSRDAELLSLRSAERQRSLEYLRSAISYFDGTSSTKDAVEILLAVHATTLSRDVDPSMATWMDLQNTGTLGLIEDATLRSDIGEYYRVFESTRRNWHVEPAHRTAVRSRVPFEVHRYLSDCRVSVGGLSPVPPPCDLASIDPEIVEATLQELADDESFLRDLRYYLTELDTQIALFEMMTERVEQLLTRLQ